MQYFLLLLVTLAHAEHTEAPPPRPVAPPPRALTPAQLRTHVREVKADVGPYSAFANCTSYTLRFHLLAQEKNVAVRSVGAICTGRPAAHAFNMIKLTTDGKWHVVDPQSTGVAIEPGFDNPEPIAPEALCRVMRATLNADGTCPCTVRRVSPIPVPYNRNPVMACALAPQFRSRQPSTLTFDECKECCTKKNSYHEQRETRLKVEWARECNGACRNHFSPPVPE